MQQQQDEQLDVHRKDLDARNAELDRCGEALAELKVREEAARARMQQLEQRQAELDAQARRLDQREAQLQQRETELSGSWEALNAQRAQVDQITEQDSQRQEELDRRLAELDALQAELQSGRETLVELQEQWERDRDAAQDALNQEIQEGEQRHLAWEQQRDQTSATLEQRERELAARSDQIATAQRALEKSEQELQQRETAWHQETSSDRHYLESQRSELYDAWLEQGTARCIVEEQRAELYTAWETWIEANRELELARRELQNVSRETAMHIEAPREGVPLENAPSENALLEETRQDDAPREPLQAELDASESTLTDRESYDPFAPRENDVAEEVDPEEEDIGEQPPIETRNAPLSTAELFKNYDFGASEEDVPESPPAQANNPLGAGFPERRGDDDTEQDHDLSVQRYMAQLLQRSGGAPEERRRTPAVQVKADKRPVPKTSEQPRPQSQSSEGEVVPPVIVRHKSAPMTSDLPAMRELANLSARAELDRYAFQRRVTEMQGKGIVAIAAVGVSALTYWFSGDSTALLGAASICLIIAIGWSVRFALLWNSVRRNRALYPEAGKPRKSAAPDSTVAAQPLILPELADLPPSTAANPTPVGPASDVGFEHALGHEAGAATEFGSVSEAGTAPEADGVSEVETVPQGLDVPEGVAESGYINLPEGDTTSDALNVPEGFHQVVSFDAARLEAMHEEALSEETESETGGQ
jgi:hypothetical protein